MLAASLSAPAPLPAQVAITDDLGRQVVLRQPARRVIALYGALADLVAALGKADVLVARTAADTGLAHLPSIGTHMRPNLELVVGARPDMVVQMAGRDEALEPVERLRELGVAVAVFRVATFADLFSVVERLAALLEADADPLLAGWRARLAAVEQAVAGAPRPTVFFEVRWPELLAAGRDSLVGEVIRAAGGSNAVAAPGRLARISPEALLALAPQVYVMQRGTMNPQPMPLADRPLLAGLPAARHGRWLMVDEARFSRPGPGSIDAVEQLARYLHPDRFGVVP